MSLEGIVRPRCYTVGFMFDMGGRVLLLRKTRPRWQAGLLNGIGGKLEEGETPYECMIREFHEEAGVYHHEWDHVTTMEGYEDDGELWHVHIFKAFVNTFPDDLTMITDVGEQIEVHDAEALPETIVPNLRWIVPLCRETNLKLVEMF